MGFFGNGPVAHPRAGSRREFGMAAELRNPLESLWIPQDPGNPEPWIPLDPGGAELSRSSLPAFPAPGGREGGIVDFSFDFPERGRRCQRQDRVRARAGIFHGSGKGDPAGIPRPTRFPREPSCIQGSRGDPTSLWICWNSHPSGKWDRPSPAAPLGSQHPSGDGCSPSRSDAIPFGIWDLGWDPVPHPRNSDPHPGCPDPGIAAGAAPFPRDAAALRL